MIYPDSANSCLAIYLLCVTSVCTYDTALLRSSPAVDRHVDTVGILDALRSPLLVAWCVDTWIRSQHTVPLTSRLE